jgi:hypothetical protein
VKTEYSEGELPLDPDFATVLLIGRDAHRLRAHVSQSRHRAKFPCESDPAGLLSSGGMLFGGMPELFRYIRDVVQG